MVRAWDVREKFCKSLLEGNNKLGKEISLGRAFLTWRHNISTGDIDEAFFSLADRTRFRFLYYVSDLLFKSEVGVFSDLKKKDIKLEPLYSKDEITADEQSLVEESLQEELEVYENSLLPMVRKLFTAPSQEENLLCFPPGTFKEIFYEIMNLKEEDDDQMHKVSDDDDDDDQIRYYAILYRDLSFIHTIIKEIPSDLMEFQAVKILLEEFETIAFEIVSLIYSCLFEKLSTNLFDERRYALPKNTSLFTEKYFSMVSGYDFEKKRKRNDEKEIILAKACFNTLGIHLRGYESVGTYWAGRIRHHILEYALDVDPWRDMKKKASKLKGLRYGYEIKKYEKYLLEEFSQVILSMLPNVHQLFTTPNMQFYQSAHDGLSPIEPNYEYLLSFINFLLGIFSCTEINKNSDYYGDDEQTIRYIFLLRNELTILFTILGDINFQFTNHDTLLPQFETIAIEIGSLIYACLFEKLTSTMFDERREAMLKNFSLLKSFIEKHFHEFSYSCPRSMVPRSTVPIDATFIVDSLIQDLENLNNSHFDCNVDDMVKQVNILRDGMSCSMSLLKEIYELPQHRDKDEHITESLIKIRDVAYEAEYLINSHVAEHSHVWYHNLRLPSVITKIKITNKTLQDVSRGEDINNFSNEALSQPLLAPAGVVDNLVVGFEEDIIKILGDLTRGSKNLNTICIFGMPGLGKTTTARKLYQDRSVSDHFDRRVWCVVSKEYEKKRVLIQILRSLEPNRNVNNVQTLNNEDIGLKIHQHLFRRRYLIVIDDVWQSSVLDELRIYFPDEANGSRILLTSRNQNVAPIGCILRSIPLLSEGHSWELLRKKVFLNEPCPPELLELGEEIAANCRGLPLALVTTAGILRNAKKEVISWEKVMKQLDTHLLDDDNSYRKILELSFENLPNHLKLCFLYVGVFPEDAEIQAGRLIRMWIAERFIHKTEEREPEDVGKEYLHDLINRSLLVIARRGNDGEIKTCTIHDQLRDVCRRRALDENFIKYIKRDEFPISGKHKCLISNSETTKWIYLPQYCRTYIGCVSTRLHSGISQMPLLRVIDTTDQRWSSVPDYFVIPGQLRYLAFRRMPKREEGDFTNLEFLLVENYRVTIPSFILKIVKLRYLRINRYAKFEEGCENSTTNSLRYLSKVCIQKDKDVEILKCSPHLRRLKCKLDAEVHDLDIRFLTELESLTVSQNRYMKHILELSFPRTIKKLHLYETELPWEKMSVIGALPNLIVLKLGNRSFVGEEWDTTEGEFLKLRFLKLVRLDLKSWNSSSEHFPELESLVLIYCDDLKAIPSDFCYHMTLQKIELIHSLKCSEELKKSAAFIGKEQRGYGNENFQVIIE